VITKDYICIMDLKNQQNEVHYHKIPISYSSEDYDGSKNTFFQRTFRFRNVTELSNLYTRERSRIIKAQKEREEFEKFW